MLADILGKSVVWPRHRECRLAAITRSGLGGCLGVAHRRGPALDVADAGQVFVELGPVAGADPPAQARGFLLDAVEDAPVDEAPVEDAPAAETPADAPAEESDSA